MLLSLIIALLIAGVLLYLIKLFIPGMDPRIYNAIVALILLAALLYLFTGFGYGLPYRHLGALR